MRREADILRDVKTLAIEYYTLTQKPLGVTGEIAELEASVSLGLSLAEARQEGYDATRLDVPGSRASNERRSMAVSQLKAIATGVWTAE